MHSDNYQSTPYQQDAVYQATTSPPKKKTLEEEALDAILATAKTASSDLVALGIDQNKIDAANDGIAAKRAKKIIAQAIAEIRRRAKAEVVTASQLLEEIAESSGIKLALRTPPGRKKKAKPEASSGDAAG